VKKPSEEEIRLLTQVVDHFDKEDESARERQLLTWRQLKLLWDGFQNTYYSEVAHDWRIAPPQELDDDQGFYDKPINIFRAYLESLIAALSATVPPIKCYPDDAENPLDMATAKAGDQISELVFRHNNANLLWVHALYIYCTEGLVACHNYSKTDESYGTYKEEQYEDIEEIHEKTSCPTCGYEFEDKLMTEGEQPTEMAEMEVCPECQTPVTPNIAQETEISSRLVGITEHPKSRQCMEAYGGLYVKVPNYAKKQADCPYLIWSYETHYALARARYSHDKELREKIQPQGSKDKYESWARLSTQYDGEEPNNNVTCRNAWLRPAAFEILKPEECDKLKKKYPKGAKVVLINDIFAESENESLDDHWTLTHNPLSDFLHHDPLGLLLVSVQEIISTIISLILQTIEHGVPQTFADPNVLDFDSYQKTEVKPGSITPAIPKSGKTMGDAFYEVKTATLSAEIIPVLQMIQSLGQITSGALPSLFGGSLEDNKTASGYSMSRSQALQRLQTPWKVFTSWWKEIFGKVIPQYIKDVKDDERDVIKDNLGNFINVFVRKSELEGKIGKIELEGNEHLPLSWQQVRDILMKLMEMNNPLFLQAMAAPENLPIIREALGLNDFYIPGEEDREKQYEEIQQLLNSEPIIQPPDEMMMMEAEANGLPPPPEQELPSVDIDPDFDNHAIHFEIVRKWVVGDAGRLAKVENQAGYKNVLLHGMMHKQILDMMMQQQQVQAEAGAPDAKRTKETNQEAPIMGDSNVPQEA